MHTHPPTSRETEPAAEDRLEGLAVLAGGVAHEFNTVLAVVLAYAELLPDLASEPARLRSVADQILAAAKRGAGIVHELQLFARTRECPRSRHDLHRLVREGVAHTVRHWPASVEVNVDVPSEPLIMDVNAPQLILALRHLLENAREALHSSGGLIFVDASLHSAGPRPEVCLRVADDGSGMAPATLEHAAEPFFSHERPARNIGFGLCVVHGVAKAHDGRMQIESRPELGNSVRLWLPAPASDSAAEDSRRPLDLAGDYA